eukprot:2144955-Amphidinium_carterae.1
MPTLPDLNNAWNWAECSSLAFHHMHGCRVWKCEDPLTKHRDLACIMLLSKLDAASYTSIRVRNTQFQRLSCYIARLEHSFMCVSLRLVDAGSAKQINNHSNERGFRRGWDRPRKST